MKRVFLSIIVLTLIFSSNINVKAQKTFKGEITYSIAYKGDNIEPAIIAMAPKEVIYKVLDNKKKFEVNQAGNYITTIIDGDKNVKITLMDLVVISKKYSLKQTKQEIETELAAQPEMKVKLSEETKDIAGYKCKKGELISKDENGKEISSVFYYSPELGTKILNFDGPYKDVDGMLLEYEMNAGGMNVKYSATKVKKSKVSDKDFLVPSDFEEMTMEQFKSMLGQ